MTETPKKKKKDIYSLLALLVGIALIAAGIIGVISSRTDSYEYKNSTDIRKVDAVIDMFSTRDDKDDNGIVTVTTYKFDISYDAKGGDIVLRLALEQAEYATYLLSFRGTITITALD